jgi:hypothetical protein
MVRIGMLAGGILAAAVARGDVTGSFEGSLAGKQLSLPLSAASALSQTGKAVTGTVALGSAAAPFTGAYLVHGKATAKRIKLSGAGPLGITFTWRAKIVGDTMQGKARLKGPGQKMVGSLTLMRNVSASDGSGCDPVFEQNRSLFEGQVMGQALTSCTACHAPGLQAQATRLHVTSSDPLATARAVALLSDRTDPTASRIIRKPEMLLPHGGGQQFAPGSMPEQILTQWIGLLVQAHCN